MPAASPLGASVKDALDAVPGVAEHPSGHSENLLRYLAPSGTPFAVGRTEVKRVRFWLPADPIFRQAAGIAGIALEDSIPKPRGASGRASNLDQITEFKRKPLLWSGVSEPAHALTLLALLVAATSPREAGIVPESPAPEPGTAAELPEPSAHVEIPAADTPKEAPVPEPSPEIAAEAPAAPTEEPVRTEPPVPGIAAPADGMADGSQAAPAEPVQPQPASASPTPAPARATPSVPAVSNTGPAQPRRGLIGRIIGRVLSRRSRRP